MIKNKQRKDGRIQAAVHLGNGKYKYVYATSNKELQTKVNELNLKLGKGLDVSAEYDTFGEWAQRWLKLKAIEVSHGRHQTYKYRVANLEPLNCFSISKIRTTDIQDIILDMAANGYAYKTLKDVRGTASQIFKLAIDNRVMDYNPAPAVKLPAEAPKTTRRALTEEEQSWINEPSDHRAHRAAMIMMYAGLRRGELIPLLWTDIDLKAKTISVNKTVEIIDGKSIVKNTAKTKAGIRTVYIPQILVDFLASEDRGNNLVVCPDASGRMMSESAYKRVWESYIYELNYKYGNFEDILVKNKQTGQLEKYKKPTSKFSPSKIPIVIPRITAHWLRHTFITMMYLAGVDLLTAKEQAGHADVQTTMEIYTHLDSVYKSKQISKLDDYLSQKNRPNLIAK